MKTSVVEKILSAVIESMWTEDLRLITEPTRFEEETGNVIVWLLESSLGQDIISTIRKFPDGRFVPVTSKPAKFVGNII